MTDLLDSSAVPGNTLAGGTDAPAGTGISEEQQPAKKRRVWSYPDLDELKPERAPLTEEEWERVLRGKRHTMIFLVTREQREWAGNQAKSCGTCVRVKLYGDPRRGFCLGHSMMTGLTFPVLCRKYAE
jgi:hypothetical protein